MNQPADMLIYGVMTRKLDIPTLLASFENDPQLARFFRPCDQTIIQYLITNNGVRDVLDFQNSIGAQAFERVQAINSSVILDAPFTPANAVVWAAGVQEDWQRRTANEVLQDALKQIASVAPYEALQGVLAKLSSVASFTSDSGLSGGYRGLQKANGLVDALLSGANSIPLGIPALEKQTPLERGKLFVLGGIFGSGKTALAMQAAYAAAVQDLKVLVCSLEMGEGDLILRESIRRLHIPRMMLMNQHRYQIEMARLQEAIRQGTADPMAISAMQQELANKERNILSPERIKAVYQENETVSKLPVQYALEAGINAAQVLAMANSAKAVMGGLDLIVIDHVEKMEPIDNKTPKAEKVKTIYNDLTSILMGSFRELPEEQKPALMVLQHLNTNIFKTEKDNIIPNASDFNYGGAGTMDTGVVIIRPWQHKRQLSSLQTDTLKNMTEDQIKKEKQKAFAYPVKGRYVESDTAIELVYEGKFFEWRQA